MNDNQLKLYNKLRQDLYHKLCMSFSNILDTDIILKNIKCYNTLYESLDNIGEFVNIIDKCIDDIRSTLRIYKSNIYNLDYKDTIVDKVHIYLNMSFYYNEFVIDVNGSIYKDKVIYKNISIINLNNGLYYSDKYNNIHDKMNSNSNITINDLFEYNNGFDNIINTYIVINRYIDILKISKLYTISISNTDLYYFILALKSLYDNNINITYIKDIVYEAFNQLKYKVNLDTNNDLCVCTSIKYINSDLESLRYSVEFSINKKDTYRLFILYTLDGKIDCYMSLMI